jgi:hypothetical protein
MPNATSGCSLAIESTATSRMLDAGAITKLSRQRPCSIAPSGALMKPKRLAADTAYGTGFLDWLVPVDASERTDGTLSRYSLVSTARRLHLPQQQVSAYHWQDARRYMIPASRFDCDVGALKLRCCRTCLEVRSTPLPEISRRRKTTLRAMSAVLAMAAANPICPR